ncbi:unnamed protein product, partial [Polarella glacialis]
MSLPSADDRKFVSELNALSARFSSAGFGDCGNLVPTKVRRQLAFALSARRRWPELGGGELRTIQAEGSAAPVDADCPFWVEGQRRYFKALASYFDAIREVPAARSSLLADLGFVLVEDYISEDDEQELIDYWWPGGPVHSLGVTERYSKRRFFNYGPILPRETQGTSKSTLS